MKVIYSHTFLRFELSWTFVRFGLKREITLTKQITNANYLLVFFP